MVASGKDIRANNSRMNNKHGNNNAEPEADRETAIGKGKRVIVAIPTKTGVADKARTAKSSNLKPGNGTTALTTETKVRGLSGKIGGQGNISQKTTVKNGSKTGINKA